jgi:Uncharacterised protein conserved in bacteria (DUF2336)
MSTMPLFPSFDGLMSLSKHEGVDIRPTLLRVLTDLYVQAAKHTEAERRQFSELASRLIDGVDDATRAAVRARLSVCPDTPEVIAAKLGLIPERAASPVVAPASTAHATPEHQDMAATPGASRPQLAMRPTDAAEIERVFAAAKGLERVRILQNLDSSPLMPAVRPGPRRAARAVETLEMAAFACDGESFALELSSVLLLPARAADRIVEDAGFEPIACACKAVGMPEEVFQRVLLFLKPALGASVMDVFRLARLYSVLSERASLIMVSVWRGATVSHVPSRHSATLYDDERRRARLASAGRPQTAARPALPQSKSRSGG